MLSCFSSIKHFSAKLNTVKIPLKMRICNPFKNPVYNVDNTEIEKLFYKDCFPDTYEIGMSHLGIKILYSLMNEMDGVWCERAFAPLPDMEENMKNLVDKMKNITSSPSINSDNQN